MQEQKYVFLTSLCREGVETGVYPGAAAVVAFRNKSTWKKVVASCGYTQSSGKGTKIEADTFFDLASLTKPLCTALGFVSLAGNKKLDLTSTVLDLPCCRDFPAHWAHIQLKDLLSHSSGLPAYREYYKKFAPEQRQENKQKLIGLIRKEQLEYTTRSCSLYSDLGYMMLGWILEEMSASTLDAFFRHKLAGPCGLDADIGFRPIDRIDSNTEHIAATELCPWRKRLMVGEVHDEHAWLMGGVAGHAGLFGKAEAVAVLCMLLVDIYHGRARHPNLAGDILRWALNYRTKAGLWALGFDRVTPGQSSSGKYFSPDSFGHLGYAGTSFWIDMQQEKIVVLLSNRVHPTRENKKIQQFRPYFHNRIMQGIGMV